MRVIAVNGRMSVLQRIVNLLIAVRRKGIGAAIRQHLGFDIRDAKSSNFLLDRAFSGALKAAKFDAVHVNYLSATPGNIGDFDGLKLVDLHDVISDRFDVRADKNLPPLARDVAKYWHRKSETALIASFDRAIAIAEEDRRELLFSEEFPPEKIVTLPAFFSADRRPGVSSERRTILFVGGTAHANVEGILWYLRNVHRQIVEKVADCELLLVGAVADSAAVKAEVGRQRLRSVQLVGHVPDLANWYGRAAVVIAPILSGTGMKIKTAEALWAGKAIVGTRAAFRGIKARHEKDALIVSEPAEFAEAVISLLTDADLRKKMEDGAQLLYAEQHSFSAAKCVIGALLEPASGFPERSRARR